jgi:hypothetical protein
MALKLFGAVERHLKNGFAKKEEGGHELVKILSAAVPLSGCGSAALPIVSLKFMI